MTPGGSKPYAGIDRRLARRDDPQDRSMATKKITAAELLAKLNADPEFVARAADRERARLVMVEELSRAEAPVVSDLLAAGLGVESVWDLVNTGESYTAVLPILVDHLPRAYPAAIREGIARALAVKESRPWWDTLTRFYRAETDQRVRGGLAAAIAASATDDVLGELIDLVRQDNNGESRVILLSVLERSSNVLAGQVLQELTTDPLLGKQARISLRVNLRRKKANSR